MECDAESIEEIARKKDNLKPIDTHNADG